MKKKTKYVKCEFLEKIVKLEMVKENTLTVLVKVTGKDGEPKIIKRHEVHHQVTIL